MRKSLAFIFVVCFAFLLVACKPEPEESRVGTVGPAGGIIFYDKGEYSNGWRYLEAAPADLRVVAGMPTVNSSTPGYAEAEPGYVFGLYRASDMSSNLFVDGTTTGEYSTDTRIDFGWANTRMLVNKMGDETYSESWGAAKTGNYAARLCEVLSYTLNGTTYDDWFLPSKDELNLMYTQLQAKGLGDFSFDSYWSSCESAAMYAWCQSFVAPSSGQQGTLEREESLGVRPIRKF